MCCVSLVLRRYFHRKEVQNPYDFATAVAVDIRTPSSFREISFENKFAFIFLKLMSLSSSCARQKLVWDTPKCKVNHLPWAAIVSFTQELCPKFFTTKINSFLANKWSCVLSNVPAPNDILTVRGSQVKDIKAILEAGCPFLLMEDKSLLESKGMRLFYQILN